jgi:phytoene synthase
MTTMDDNFRHCEQVVRAADKDRFLATLFAPAERRGPLFALHAFSVEVACVRHIVREPMAGEIRLQWWRDVLDGERREEAAASPVAAALLETIARFALPVAPLLRLIEARAFDLYDDPMPDVAALEAYLDATDAVPIALAAQILAGAHPAIMPAARRAGLACGMAGLLRTGRPLGFADLPARAAVELAAFEALLATLPAATAPAFLPVALVRGDLARRDLPQWRRQWTLWRAARRYERAMRG